MCRSKYKVSVSVSLYTALKKVCCLIAEKVFAKIKPVCAELQSFQDNITKRINHNKKIK